MKTQKHTPAPWTMKESGSDFCWIDNPMVKDHSAACKQARAVIAKAEGK